MNDEINTPCSKCLSELSIYHFPSNDLTKPPYKKYTEIYCDESNELTFFNGYINPDRIIRCKIYRAVDLCSNEKIKFTIFTSLHGLVIKYIGKFSDDLIDIYDKYINQENNYIFIPTGYDKLNKYDYVYYRKLLANFVNDEEIKCKIINMIEQDTHFLFLCLDSPENLSNKWKEYINGGVLRDFLISVDKIPKAFDIFPWSERYSFSYNADEPDIIMTVISPSIKDFESKIKILNKYTPADKMYLLDVGQYINDVNEAFGVCKLLSFKCIPLVGTSKICVNDNSIKVCMKDERIYPDEGIDIFSQDEFSKMSILQKASLIQTPSNGWYYFLDLYQSKREDPINRESFSQEFIETMNAYVKQYEPFTLGFPPILFDPELVSASSTIKCKFQHKPTISFYIKMSKFMGRINFFWQISDLRDTKYADLTNMAINMLINKWSDKSLFNSKILRVSDEFSNLSFSPKVLYMFAKSSMNFEIFHQDIEKQAKCLKKQIRFLENI